MTTVLAGALGFLAGVATVAAVIASVAALAVAEDVVRDIWEDQ